MSIKSPTCGTSGRVRKILGPTESDEWAELLEGLHPSRPNPFPARWLLRTEFDAAWDYFTAIAKKNPDITVRLKDHIIDVPTTKVGKPRVDYGDSPSLVVSVPWEIGSVACFNAADGHLISHPTSWGHHPVFLDSFPDYWESAKKVHIVPKTDCTCGYGNGTLYKITLKGVTFWAWKCFNMGSHKTRWCLAAEQAKREAEMLVAQDKLWFKRHYGKAA
jgi:hypothetical protein